MVAAAAVAAVLIVAGYAAVTLGLPADLISYDGRGQGLFKDPNVAAAFVSCAFPLTLSLLLSRNRVLLLFLVSAATGIAVIYAGSRTGLVLYGLAALTGTAVSHRSRSHVAAIVAGLLLAALAVTTSGYDWGRYTLIHDYDSAGRFVTWCYGLQMLAEAPAGTGAGSFERRATERYTANALGCGPTGGGQSITTPSAHNTYLRVAVESGVAGAALFAAVLLVVTLRVARRRVLVRDWPLAAGIALVFVAGLLIDTLHWRQLWLYAGLALARE